MVDSLVGSRKRLTLAFGVLVGVMAMAAAAFACTAYKGTFTVTPTGGTGSGVSSSVGNGTGMNYCSTSWGATFASTGQTFDASVSAGGCATAGALRNGTYTVNYFPGGSSNDCMNPGGLPLGTMSVSGGSGSGSYSLQAAVPGSGQICVSDLTAGQGNQLQVNVV